MLVKLRQRLTELRQSNQGIALITTLAVISLVTVIVVALLIIGKQGVLEGKAELDGCIAELMVDNTVEIVKARLHYATSQKMENGLPRLWVSQPGAITQFSQDGKPAAIHKLYSSNQSVINTASIPSPTQIAATDMPVGWADQPDHFVDLNAPQGSPSGVIYPILDPALLGDSSQAGVEGFSSTALPGEMPMPVRWLYVLQDGTLGTLDVNDYFVPLDPALVGRERTQPIMARIAYWVDDETCKINLNTAGEAAYWDLPVADTAQERCLAQQQPIRTEFARMPAHPGGVCLSSVFYPGQRFYPDGFYSSTGPPALSNAELSMLWQMGRYPVGGGLAGRPPTDWFSIWDLPDTTLTSHHRYITLDEAVFSAAIPTSGPTQDGARGMNALFNASAPQIQRLSKASGFLTAQSSAPELTLYGTPRISTWPVHAQTLPNMIAARTANTAPAALDPASKDTLYNRKAAFSALIQDTPYFFQRSEPGHGGADLEYNAEGNNKKLYEYLNKLTATPPPGHSLPEQEYNSLAEKYGDDMPAISMGALDYIRSTNLADGQLTPQSQFSILCPGHGNESYGFGQISPLQPRLVGDEYLTSRQQHSLGRICTVSEVALHITCRAEVVREGGKLVVKGEPSSTKNSNALKASGEGAREIEVSLLLETFLPGHSWTDYRPYLTALLTGGDPGKVQPYKNSTSLAEFPVLKLNGKQLEIDGNRVKISSSNQFHPRWNGAGGFLGIMALSSGTLSFKPIIVPANGSTTTPIPVQFEGGSGQTKELKIVLYDSAQSTNNYDLHQVIPLKLPDISAEAGIYLPKLQNDLKPSLSSRMNDALAEDKPIIHGTDILQSLLPLHGDSRLTATQRWQEHEINGVRTLYFAPHPQWGQRAAAHQLQDNALLPANSSAKAGPIPDLKYAQGSDLPATMSQPDTTLRIWHAESWQTHTASSALKLLRKDNEARGAALPQNSGDYDNGLGPNPDGSFSNRQDDGHWAAVLAQQQTPYFSNVSQTKNTVPPVSVQTFNAQRILPSPGVFGSLPTGTVSQVPWQTLLFRPQPEHYGAKEVPDHLFLDLFYTPVLEPYPLSLNYETEGKINLNQDLFPFSHIQRKTALHALLKGEAITAIPDTDSEIYKSGQATTSTYRHFIDPTATLKLWQQQLAAQRGLCRTASQICELYLVPEAVSATNSSITEDQMQEYWKNHRLTGDNSRERPYTRLYPRLTTQSNSYCLHLRVQILQPAKSSVRGTFKGGTGRILAERSGKVLLRRQLDLPKGAPSGLPATDVIPDFRSQLPSVSLASSVVRPLTDRYRWSRGPLLH
jgi:hypothetical protein